MKRFTGILFLCCISLQHIVAQPFDGNSYILIPQVSDEFNTSPLNTTLWDNSSGHAEGVVFESSYVQSGQASTFEMGTKVCDISAQYVTPQVSVTEWDGTYSSNYVCGQITSTQLFKYGYYETRMKEPTSIEGVCSSFWLWNGSSSDGYSEIDVQENSASPASFAVTKDQWGNLDTSNQGENQLRNAIAYTAPNDKGNWPYHRTLDIKDANGNLVDITQVYHTYGLNWQPTYIDFYMDGILKTHFTSAQFSYTNQNNQTSNLPVSSFIPMMVVFWTKLGDATYFNSQNGKVALEVDYFRYYRNKPDIAISTITFASRTADLTFSNSLGDTYTFSTGTQLNSSTVRLQPTADNTSLTITQTSTNPTASITIPTKNIWFPNNTTANVCNNTSSDIVIANAIVAPQTPCTSSPVYVNGRNINYIARDGITLNGGFEVQLGATFSADVKGQ